MAIGNFYKDENKIKTELSGGREHYKFRPTVHPISYYEYSLKRSENPYTVAKDIMGTDTKWWVVADINPPKDAFSWTDEDVLKVPETVVESTYATPDIF